VILGGGVIEAVNLLFDVAEARARREALPAAGAKLDIVRAALGDNSASSARRSLEQTRPARPVKPGWLSLAC